MCVSQVPGVTASSDIEGCGAGWVLRRDGIRVGTGVGYTGTPSHPARGGPRTSEACPGSPARGLEWVGTGAGRPGSTEAAGSGPVPPSGSGRSPAGPSLYRTLENAASWPIRARFRPFYCKVSQNGIVSSKSVEKACHSPYFQNELQKSPLEILRFPFCSAFSPKELMVPF